MQERSCRATSSEKKIIYNGENEVFENSSSKTNKQTERQANRTRKEEKVESANETDTDYRFSVVAAINGHG